MPNTKTINQESVDKKIEDALNWQTRAVVEATLQSEMTGQSPKVVVTEKLIEKHKTEAREQIKKLLHQERLNGRKDIAQKAVEHKERADFFTPEAEVVLVSNLEWLASLD